MRLAALPSYPTRNFRTSISSLDMRLIKTVHESRHETSELMMPEHANNLGHVFGGVILSMMDKTAAIAAFRHSRSTVVTASIDRVDFREPIHLGDLVVMQASVNYVGRSSMEVGVHVEAEDLLTGRRRHTNSCYLTFVAVDRNGRPIEVPELKPETEDEIRRFAAAQDIVYQPIDPSFFTHGRPSSGLSGSRTHGTEAASPRPRCEIGRASCRERV